MSHEARTPKFQTFRGPVAKRGHMYCRGFAPAGTLQHKNGASENLSVDRSKGPKTEKIQSRLNQAPKRGINIKNFVRNPLLDPPLQGTRDPTNASCLGPLFPSKYRKKPKHKEFLRGGGS